MSGLILLVYSTSAVRSRVKVRSSNLNFFFSRSRTGHSVCGSWPVGNGVSYYCLTTTNNRNKPTFNDE